MLARFAYLRTFARNMLNKNLNNDLLHFLKTRSLVEQLTYKISKGKKTHNILLNINFKKKGEEVHVPNVSDIG